VHVGARDVAEGVLEVEGEFRIDLRERARRLHRGHDAADAADVAELDEARLHACVEVFVPPQVPLELDVGLRSARRKARGASANQA
jgi:hypothetical protein